MAAYPNAPWAAAHDLPAGGEALCSVRPRGPRDSASGSPAPPPAPPPVRLRADQAFIRQLLSLVERIFLLGERDVGVDEALNLERRDPVTFLTLSVLLPETWWLAGADRPGHSCMFRDSTDNY